MTVSWALLGGLVAGFLALAAAAVAVVGWQPRRVPIDRRMPPGTSTENGQLTLSTRRVVNATQRGLARSGRLAQLTAALESAGQTTKAAEYLLVVGAAALSAAAVGMVLGGPLVGLLGAVMTPVMAKLALGRKTNRRRARFADQLDDTLQLLAGSLRAGHSLLRAIDAVSTEAEAPTSLEFSRIINETRVGRDLGNSLDQTARRTACEDFSWVAQAISIHREVGGDLADVLDTVSHTIRERNQIRRQVRALSAEGRMSGMVLMMLPIGISGFLLMTNPGYLGKLTENVVGWSMVAAAVLMMVVGGLWLKKVVSFKF